MHVGFALFSGRGDKERLFVPKKCQAFASVRASGRGEMFLRERARIAGVKPNYDASFYNKRTITKACAGVSYTCGENVAIFTRLSANKLLLILFSLFLIDIAQHIHVSRDGILNAA